MRKPFTKEEKDEIIRLYPIMDTKELAKKLNRNWKVIKHFAYSQGVKKPVIDLTNQKIGKLQIIGLSNKKAGRERLWKCQCECGKNILMRTYALNKRGTLSCGCYRIEKISNSYGKISGVWYGKIKGNAQKRKLEFNVSIEFLNDLLEKQNFKCAISGLPIKIEMGRTNKITTASLDRVDNTKPYTEDNVQFLHKHVNYMKWTHKQDYFIKLCHKISKYNRKKN